MQILYTICICCQTSRLIPTKSTEIGVYVVIYKPLRTCTLLATGSRLACALVVISSVLLFHHNSLINIFALLYCRYVSNTIIGYGIVSFQYPLASNLSIVAVLLCGPYIATNAVWSMLPFSAIWFSHHSSASMSMIRMLLISVVFLVFIRYRLQLICK